MFLLNSLFCTPPTRTSTPPWFINQDQPTNHEIADPIMNPIMSQNQILLVSEVAEVDLNRPVEVG